MTGSLPEGLGSWESLKSFLVAYNQMTGTLPDSIGSWSSIDAFFVNSNRFTGTLPGTIGNWNDITQFHAEVNSFSGTLPPSIGNWTSLTRFALGIQDEPNNFTGTLPDSIGNWVDLEVSYCRGVDWIYSTYRIFSVQGLMALTDSFKLFCRHLPLVRMPSLEHYQTLLETGCLSNLLLLTRMSSVGQSLKLWLTGTLLRQQHSMIPTWWGPFPLVSVMQ